MQYQRGEGSGKDYEILGELPKKNIDTGMGVDLGGVQDGTDLVGLVEVLHALQQHGHALDAHAGVDVLLLRPRPPLRQGGRPRRG
jgi:hypothetical protein